MKHKRSNTIIIGVVLAVIVLALLFFINRSTGYAVSAVEGGSGESGVGGDTVSIDECGNGVCISGEDCEWNGSEYRQMMCDGQSSQIPSDQFCAGCKLYPKSSETCLDSDNGKNYQQSGIITLSGNQWWDYCDGHRLTEYYCDGNSTDYPAYETYNCPYGCRDGACLLDVPEAIPTLDYTSCYLQLNSDSQYYPEETVLQCSGNEVIVGEPFVYCSPDMQVRSTGWAWVTGQTPIMATYSCVAEVGGQYITKKPAYAQGFCCKLQNVDTDRAPTRVPNVIHIDPKTGTRSDQLVD